MSEGLHYIGRFAPSPTGPLHFGSLVAAMGSYLQARSRNGQWLLRIEDLDQQREVPGAALHIIATLEQLGFQWDGEIIYQSQRGEIYRQTLDTLQRQGSIYNCSCSRKQIQELAGRGPYGLIYPGTCRSRSADDSQTRALRVITHDQELAFTDGLLGRYQQRLESEIGDFVVLRADGFVAYQLAVVVDDALQNISEVVRGADLLDNTPRQLHLQRLLGYPQPSYYHLPVATNVDGQKLSKQTGALAIDPKQPIPLLLQTLQFLNQPLPGPDEIDSLKDLWHWAITHWDMQRVPKQAAVAPNLGP